MVRHEEDDRRRHLGRGPHLPGRSGCTSRLGKHRPVYYTATWRAEVRPGNIPFGADGGLWVRYLGWQHWNGTSAYATGRLWANTCNPTCSAGHYKKYNASVTLWRVRNHGKQPYYTRLTLRYWKNGRKLTTIYTLGGDGPQ